MNFASADLAVGAGVAAVGAGVAAVGAGVAGGADGDMPSAAAPPIMKAVRAVVIMSFLSM
jgi:hypothetical protein